MSVARKELLWALENFDCQEALEGRSISENTEI